MSRASTTKMRHHGKSSHGGGNDDDGLELRLPFFFFLSFFFEERGTGFNLKESCKDRECPRLAISIASWKLVLLESRSAGLWPNIFNIASSPCKNLSRFFGSKWSTSSKYSSNI